MKKSIGIIGILLFAFWPVFHWYINRLNDGSDEPLGLIALATGIFFLYQKRQAVQITTRGIFAASVVLIAYATGFAFFPPMIRAALAILCFALLTESLIKIPAVWVVIGLSLPVIASLQFYAGYPMRLIASVSAERFLNAAGMEVTRHGTELWRDGGVVGVDPACSGIEMLWTGLLLVACFAAWMNWRLGKTILALVGGILIMIVANCARVILLYFKESGLVDLPEWTHEGIGVLLFGIAILLLKGSRRTLPAATDVDRSLSRSMEIFGASAVVLALIAPFVFSSPASAKTATDFPGWPKRWNGKHLEPLPLSESEQSFARTFPGKLAVFSTGPEKVVYRWVTRPTRSLHSSADCLRASGFQIKKERGGVFLALGPDGGLYWVEESVSNSRETFSEISQWYWRAVLGKTRGPWWAVTVIRPIGR